MPAPHTIRGALDAGVRPDYLAVAAHEVGHGIAWHTAGIRIDHMAVEVGWFGGLKDSYCRRADGFILDAGNALGFLIGLAAGGVAHYRLLTDHLGYRPRQARREVRVGAEYDDEEFDRLRGLHGQQRLSLDDAWQLATQLLDSQARHLDTLTVRLATDRRLPGRAL